MTLHDKLIRERDEQSRRVIPMFIVCNLYSSGSRSVGTRPMDREETIASVAARTGLSVWKIGAVVDNLANGSVILAKNACNFEGSTDVLITREEN